MSHSTKIDSDEVTNFNEENLDFTKDQIVYLRFRVWVYDTFMYRRFDIEM